MARRSVVQESGVVHIGSTPGEQYGWECVLCDASSGLAFGNRHDADVALEVHRAEGTHLAAVLSTADVSFLSHYRVDGPWIFDAASILPDIMRMVERGYLAPWMEGDTLRGHSLTEAGAAALAESRKG
jgi:hypothetical protein